ncbi:hypothetical protein KZ483_00725 [Paenibacillus sp. sptzw28]|uniref:hypothetical protein n=1 Tax=Paenibacillus sp. sptzw28 TaxID=715179 RepID=UPI001C6EFB16|nr:hypothetical protein [Paenibacillus sp. sptzw28]QYR21622.1 hypothetical protein KZ483_00725 [Paenibacillus sp. sptzw28]
MKLPAFRKDSKDNEVVWIDIHTEMLMMTIDTGDLVIETMDGTFVLPNSLDEWARILQSYGYEKSDRNCILKLDRIVDYDDKARLLYFTDSKENKRLSATASNRSWEKIKQSLKMKRQKD